MSCLIGLLSPKKLCMKVNSSSYDCVMSKDGESSEFEFGSSVKRALNLMEGSSEEMVVELPGVAATMVVVIEARL